MNVRLMNTVLGVTAVLLVAAACAHSEAGTPIPERTTTPTVGGTTGSATPSGGFSVPGSTDRHGAPPVANPLDTTKFLTQPCSALTPQQLQNFNLPAQGKPDTDSAVAKYSGPSCSWINSDAANAIGVGFLTGNKNGLADLYRANEEGKWAGYWEPTAVAGYPGVFHDVIDARLRGTCVISVGVSETLAVMVNEQGRLKEQSCDLAKQVAAAVVETLKRGG